LKLDESCIGNPKVEILNWTSVSRLQVQSEISTFGFPMQDSSNFKFLPSRIRPESRIFVSPYPPEDLNPHFLVRSKVCLSVTPEGCNALRWSRTSLPGLRIRSSAAKPGERNTGAGIRTLVAPIKGRAHRRSVTPVRRSSSFAETLSGDRDQLGPVYQPSLGLLPLLLDA
jgi:hypothetical protein